MTAHTLYKNVSNILLVLCLGVILSALPFGNNGGVSFVNAQSVVVVGGPGSDAQITSAAANIESAGFQGSLFLKEMELDGIAHGVAKMFLKSMTQSILNWINSGFQGSPAFIDDLESYLVDRADEIVGDYIYNDPSLNFLCSPFQLDVKTTLNENYQDTTRGGSTVQCTLSDVTDNIEGFLGGNFSDGGWPAWFEVTQNPQNTPTGAYLLAEAELDARIMNDQQQTLRELDWGDGFLSFKVCDQGSRGFGSSTDRCDITTPGAVIADQINASLGAGQDALIEADEINEIIAALFAQLAQQALTGFNGLLGLGGSAQYSSSGHGPNNDLTFLEAMGLEETPTGSGLSGDNPIAQALATEIEYRELQQGIIDDITAAEDRITTHNEAQTAGSGAFGGDQEDAACMINLITPSALDRARDDAADAIAEGDEIITTLTTLNDQYETAGTEETSIGTEFDLGSIDPDNLTENTPQIKSDIMNEFMVLMGQGLLTTGLDIAIFEIEIENDIEPALDAFNLQITNAITACNSGGSGGGGGGGN